MKTFDDYLEMAKTPSVHDMFVLFTLVNKDAKKNGDSVVRLTDWDYYSTQIQNIYGVDDDTAESLAKQLAQYVKAHKEKIEGIFK